MSADIAPLRQWRYMAMITGDKNIDNIMELAEAVFVCPDPTKYSQAVVEAKYEAIRKTLSCTKHYREQGILSELVHTVFTKKLAMIKAADTVKDLKAIEKGCIPHFNGNQFFPGPFHIPEEELIMWSLTSLKAPLVSAGLRRYAELFEQVFGVDIHHCTAADLDKARKRLEVS